MSLSVKEKISELDIGCWNAFGKSRNSNVSKTFWPYFTMMYIKNRMGKKSNEEKEKQEKESI